MKNYAIIDQKGGWLENLVIWDGNLETWQPPNGTIAKLVEDVDVETLPEKPQE